MSSDHQIGLPAILSQEQATEKPTLYASPQLGSWLQEVGGGVTHSTVPSLASGGPHPACIARRLH